MIQATNRIVDERANRCMGAPRPVRDRRWIRVADDGARRLEYAVQVGPGGIDAYGDHHE